MGAIRVFRAGLTYFLFPTAFCGALYGAHWGAEQGFEHGLVLAVITVLTVLLIGLVERIHPAHETWRKPHGDVGTDAMHALISQIILPKAMEIGLQGLVLTFAILLSESMGGAFWPSSWPVAVQLFLALMITQFGEYWWHRLAHQVPLFWRFHAVHHSSERLYWLNAARFHPVDTGVSYFISLASLGVLGLEPEILLLVTTWIAVHGLFQHCNIHLRLGPLNYIFSMAELHRWHHSLILEEANSNYGNNIIFWDLVFGTFFYPKDRDALSTIGISDMPNFPKKYIAQIMVPFRWRRTTELGAARKNASDAN
jgi:ornithine lipid hydroxylase